MSTSYLSAKYAPGAGAGVAGEKLWVVVAASAGEPLSLACLAAVSGGADAEAVLEVLVAGGLRLAPDFAICELRESGGCRIVVRGAAQVEIGGGGRSQTLVGSGIFVDQEFDDPEWVALRLGDESAGAVIPLSLGLVPAQQIRLDISARAVVAPAAPWAVGLSQPPSPAPSEVPAAEAVVTVPSVVEVAGVAPSIALAGIAGGTASGRATDRPDPGASEQEATLSAYHDLLRAGDLPAAPDPEVVATPREIAPAPSVSLGVDEPLARISTNEWPDGPTEAGTSALPGQGLDEELSVAHRGGPVAAPPSTQGDYIDVVPGYLLDSSLASPRADHTARVAAPGGPAPAVGVPTPAQETAPGDAVSMRAQAHEVGAAADATRGRTVSRASIRREQGQPALTTVLAARCPQGHLTQAKALTCRVCGAAVPPQPAMEITRPALGRLVFATGDVFSLDRDVVLGRDPRVPDDHTTGMPHLVKLNDPREEVSSQHALISLNYWLVRLTDLGSMNGTEIIVPDGRRQRLVPHTAVVIEPGTLIILAEIMTIRFEVTP